MHSGGLMKFPDSRVDAGRRGMCPSGGGVRGVQVSVPVGGMGDGGGVLLFPA